MNWIFELVLDQRLVRENPSLISRELGRRGLQVDIEALQQSAKKQNDLQQRRSDLQGEGNKIGKLVGQKIKEGIDPQANEIIGLRVKGNEIKKEVALLEQEEKSLLNEINQKLLSYPNLPSKHCPDGANETENVEIRRWGNPRNEKNLLEHWEIAYNLELFDTERSSKISQSRFVTLLNQGAKLERALINFMLDLHSGKGYQEVLPPVLVNTTSLTSSGQLPKFAEESFKCAEDDLWLTPTAEVPVTSFHREEIIPIEKLPLKYAAYSPCFRREAGSYGRDTRGLIRLHQFNKVELYWFCHPEESEKALEEITKDAENILKALELPYRVIELCAGDLGFSAARTYDLEVWLPGAGSYREISSCSLCGDFQARRSSIRTKEGKKTRLVHTLNGSGLAVGRTMAALLENGQQPDGFIKLPEVLIPYFGASHLKPGNKV